MSLTHKPPRNIVDVNLTRVIASRCAAMLMKSGDKKGNFQMQKILVIDRNQQPLMPCHPARARQLLALGKASVFKRYPFTIVLHDRAGGARQVVAVKIDPGSKETGLVLVGDFERGKRVIWAAESLNVEFFWHDAFAREQLKMPIVWW